MSLTNTYYVPKQSGTYTDVLVANGLAALIDRIFQHTKEQGYRIEVADLGPYYQLGLSEPLQESWLEKIGFSRSPTDCLTSNGKDESAPPNVSTRSVNQTGEQVRADAEQRSALYQQGLRGSDPEAQIQDMEPRHDWQVVAFLGDWRMQARGIYNRHVSAWSQTRPHFIDHLKWRNKKPIAGPALDAAAGVPLGQRRIELLQRPDAQTTGARLAESKTESPGPDKFLPRRFIVRVDQEVGMDELEAPLPFRKTLSGPTDPAFGCLSIGPVL